MKKSLPFLVCLLLIFFGKTFLSAQDMKWAIRVGGSGKDIGFNVAVDSSKRTYAAQQVISGTSVNFNGSCTITGGSNSYDVSFVRLDTVGACTSSKYIITQNDNVMGLRLDSLNNIYIVGNRSGTNSLCTSQATSGQDILLAKLGSTGTCSWGKKIGGSSGDYGYRLSLDRDGNIYITGSFAGSFSFEGTSLSSSGSNDGFIAKFNNSGTIQWVKKFGGTGDDFGYGISNVVDGYLYVCGRFQNTGTFGTLSAVSAGGYDAFIAKVDASNGSFVWLRRAGVTGAQNENGIQVVMDKSGNAIYTVLANTGAIFGTDTIPYLCEAVVMYDSNGNVQWTRTMGKAAGYIGPSVTLHDSTIYFAGAVGATTSIGSFTATTAGSADILIAALDYSGKPLWVKTYGSTSSDYAMEIACDKDGDLYVAGVFGGTVNFGGISRTSSGSNDVFYFKATPPLLITKVAEGENMVCGTGAFDVEYRAGITYDTTNVFTVQLSDTAGSFANPVPIGTLSATTSGTITASIPDTIPASSKYRLRIVASNPSATGAEYTTNFRLSQIPSAPTPPAPQTSCSDTAVLFTFDSIQPGSGGNQIEWALSSSFDTTEIIESNGSINRLVESGAMDTLWMRSRDSITGCVSEIVWTAGGVNELPENVTPYTVDTMVCAGSSTYIKIPNSQVGVLYELMVNSVVVNIEFGTGDTLNISTGVIDTNTMFTVAAIDTGTGCLKEYASVNVTIPPMMDTVMFNTGDTILCTGSTSCYTAAATNSVSIVYSINGGGAVIDSASGCVSQVTSSFTVKATCFGLLGCDTIEGFMNVYVPYITISMPSPLGVLSDTPHLFIMEPISVGGRGNLIEWSADSAFTASYTDTSPTSISAIVNPGADTLIWLRAIDSVTGCVSKAATIQMIVMSTDTLPDPVYDTIITQCVGTSVEIPIANTHGGYLYSLRIDTTVVASSLGNDDVLILNTGAIDTMTLFNIIAADTTKTTYEILDSAILVMVLEPVDTPIFYEGDTFVYALDSLVYIAVAENAVFTNYSILSGDATIDTLTGVVFHPNSDFVVRATATGLTGCGTTTADLQVTVTNIASPIAPESQYVVADSFEAKTVTLSAVQAGEGGDEIEWAVNLDFDNSTIVSSPADIGLMLEAGSDSLIWLRSRNSTTGKVSRSLRRQRKNEYKVMSAGILDKTHWEYNAERSDEFTYGDLAELRNSDKWFFGICFDAGSALPVDCDIENCATHWVLAKNESTGNWYQQSEDYINNYTTETGDGGEVDILDPGIAAFTATKLALPKTSPYNATTCAYPFEAPLSFHYQSGGVVAKNFVVNLSETSLMELRCITPAGTGAWPSFWTFGGSFEFDMFENYNGASKTTSNVHDNDRPEGQRGCQYSTWKKTDCDYSQDWHTYSILINTEEIIFFVDGKETRSIDRTVNPYPQNMTNGNKGILTFGLGIQQGADDESYQMLVDYFRYYTPKANTGSECNIPKRSLQNLDVCTAKTLENTRYSSTLSHHYPAPVVNSFIHVTRDITGANLGVISSGSNTKVFFNSYTLCGIATQYSNGLWTESAILPVEFFKVWLPFHGKVNIPLPRFPDVKNYITPVTEKLVYYQSLGNRLQYYSYNSFWGLWEKRIPLIAGKKNRPIPANCAGYLNTDFAGRIWYKGTDKKIWCWNPLLKEHTSLNHTSLVEGSMVMHTCGCLTYYCDNQHNLRQMQWHNGTWTSSANPVVDIWEIPLHGTIPQHVNILGDLLIDEAEGRSRVYFIGSNHAVYYYSWITQETVKLKFSSVQDANNNETRCELYHNAASQLTLSPDGNMIYYRGTDDKIWYYFSDREDSKILIDNDELLLVARENWNKTPMDYSSSIMGPMAFKPGPFGDLYYAGQRNKLHVVKWVSADIPAPCPESDGWQIASYKTDNSNGTDMPEVKDSHDSSRAALDTSNVISVKVYPNPSHDVFFIEIAGVESGSFIDIQIETPAGKAVFESRQRIAAGSKYHHLRWDADNVPLGLYLYKIYSGKGQVSYGKIIKM